MLALSLRTSAGLAALVAYVAVIFLSLIHI